MGKRNLLYHKSLKYAGLFITGFYILTQLFQQAGGEYRCSKNQKRRNSLAESNLKRYSQLPFFVKMIKWEKYVTNEEFLMISNRLDELT